MILSSIAEFIHSEKVATICCAEGTAPYCFNCFYAFDENGGWLVYKSSGDTHHDKLLAANSAIAGTIIPHISTVESIRGVQFLGELITEDTMLITKATDLYHARFPFAKEQPGVIHVFALHKIKFTDNSKGFGHKEHWSRG